MEFPFIKSDYPPPKNLYLDMQQPDSRPALISTPGLDLYCDFASSAEIRGMHYVQAQNALYVVCGANVYKVTGKQSYELIDTISTSTGFVWMEDNGIELLISDGTNGYVYDYTTTFSLLGAELGQYATFVIKSNGLAYGCGINNPSGMVGDNTITDRSSHVQVVGEHSFASIVNGAYHSIGLKSSGQAWAWGLNTDGQVGDNTVASKSSPVQVIGSHSFIKVSGGAAFSLGLKANGLCWTWGYNDEGQLGDDTVDFKSSPVYIAGSHSFIDISAGLSHSLGLKADGSIWAWGNNGAGQLGDGTATNRSSPVAVVGSHSFIDISAGDFSLARKADGSVWAWGDNTQGGLGDGSKTDRSSPVAVVGAHSFSEIAASRFFSAARKADGSVWAWGHNTSGQLGINTGDNGKSSPVVVVGSHSFVEISVGDYHCAARKAEGSIWAWGGNTYGQLGDNTTDNKSSPVVIIRKFQPLSSIGPTTMGTITFIDGYMATNDVGTQRWHISGLYEAANWPDLDYTSAEEKPDYLMAIIMNQGELWTLGKTTTEVYQNTGAADFPFARIPGAFLDVGCGAAASVCQKDNSIFWLDNNKRVRRAGGPLGYSSAVISTAAVDEELSTYGDVSNAEGFTFSHGGHDFWALTFPSIPKTWVYDITTSAHAQTHIWHERASGSLNRWLVRCYTEFGGKHVFGAYNTGKLYSAETSKITDYGLSLTRRYLGPVIRKDRKRLFFNAFEVEIDSVHGPFYGIATSANTTYLTYGNGSVYSTGIGTSGALGDNTATSKSSPVAVVGSHSFVKIEAGSLHGIGLKYNGEAWAWGANTAGGLGDGSITSRSSPVIVVGAHSFIDVSAGTHWSLGLKASGGAWSWGFATGGMLGDGTETPKSSPVAVIGSHSFGSISAGGLYGGGLKADGSVWTWGTGTHGRLGDGTATSKSSPVAVVGSHSFVEISLGYEASAARKASGAVWTWGENNYGQLGNGNTTDYSSPVTVVGSHSFIQVSNAVYHMLGLKSNGEAWAWGRGTEGQLGDNTKTNKSSPVQVVGNHSFIKVIAGENHSVGLKANGEAWSWGEGTNGALGDNTITGKSSPVLVVSSYRAQATADWKNEHEQWSSEYSLEIPTDDNSYVRTRLNRCGSGRSRQYRVTVSDPVDVKIKAAYTEMEDEK